MPMNVDMFCSEEGQPELLMENSPAERPSTCLLGGPSSEGSPSRLKPRNDDLGLLLRTSSRTVPESVGARRPNGTGTRVPLAAAAAAAAAAADAKQVPCPALLASPALYSCGGEEHSTLLRTDTGVTSTWNVQRPGHSAPPSRGSGQARQRAKDKGKAEVPTGVEVHRPSVDHCSLSLLALSSFPLPNPLPAQFPVNVTHSPWALGSDVSMVQGMLI
ncbi:hypothetical protein BDP55DRAFT_744016 [Colletotrichum godetiae]|uniref:Uncharacterized protein n=1 Tax=Colletotrichum godetiae TaxID=1209918 RepID=A0AAJ0AKX3_9PEZI|nr:uncharacterized protein BDP55DRAFT_744016 [Colletotrichum godetiae]KAK1675777.1 hypothetical protein BDP55DRAFT_744016 [Colletotrichum godetiae]